MTRHTFSSNSHKVDSLLHRLMPDKYEFMPDKKLKSYLYVNLEMPLDDMYFLGYIDDQLKDLYGDRWTRR